jgi:ABC-type transporter Mla subunit MlaD
MRMEQLNGVQKGTLIMYQNFNVGEVVNVEPLYSKAIYFRSEIRLDNMLQLYRDCKFIISKQNVIGETFIEVVPGTDFRFPLEEGATVFTENNSNLTDLLSELNIVVGDAAEVVSLVKDVAGKSKSELGLMLGNLNLSIIKINRLLDSTEGEIIETMRNLRLTSGTLEKFSREVAENPWRLLESKEKADKPSRLP